MKAKPLRLICGLGNPGKEYANTRHSIGFATLDAIFDAHNLRFWKPLAGCDVATIPESVYGREVYLVKPLSYMNTSGGPLSKVMRELNIDAKEIIVVHDEVDLEAGIIKAKKGGGLNAHNGLRSIAAKLTTQDFCRLRCGIGRPPGKMSVADWTLRQLKGQFLEDFLFEAQEAASLLEEIARYGIDSYL